MTRKEQIAKALAILKDQSLRSEVETALDFIDAISADYAMSRETQSRGGRAQLRRFRKLLEDLRRAYAHLPSIEQYAASWLHREVGKLYPFIKAQAELPARAPARSSFKQKACVREAHELLVAAGRPVVTTSGGDWDRLSAILYGAPNASLQRHLTVRRQKRSGRKIARDRF